MPIYFYPLLLAIKTPLPVLGAFLVGLIEVWKRRREPGPSFLLFMFLLWIIPFSLLEREMAQVHARLDADDVYDRRSRPREDFAHGHLGW